MSYAGSTYRCSKKINAGGMAELYVGLAINATGFRRLCAIKKILPEHASKPVFLDLMKSEAHLCQSLHHANIVQVWGFETIDDSYGIVMEYVNGPDLGLIQKVCHKTRINFSIPMSCFVAAEVARALSYVHTRKDELSGKPLGIVHLDISPSNILVSYEGEVKITDFGIAIARQAKFYDDQQSNMRGKFSYMSPEQISGKPVDARTDIYSLGVVLWEMIAGGKLFTPNKHDEARGEAQAHLSRLEKIAGKLDEDLAAIILKCLAVQPEHRYQTAAEFELALARYVQHQHPDFTRQRLARFIQMTLVSEYESTQLVIKSILAEPEERSLIEFKGEATAPRRAHPAEQPAEDDSDDDMVPMQIVPQQHAPRQNAPGRANMKEISYSEGQQELPRFTVQGGLARTRNAQFVSPTHVHQRRVESRSSGNLMMWVMLVVAGALLTLALSHNTWLLAKIAAVKAGFK
jgi:serine/threonine-protein kinase